MASYRPLTDIPLSLLTNSGTPANGYVLYAYVSGTTTPATLYQDAIGTSAGSSVTLDSRGEPTTIKRIWLDTSVTYKLVLKTDAGVTVWTSDPVYGGYVTSDRTANVLSHGAAGNGVADDTAAIQAAADSLADGGVVTVPAGDYKITGTVTIPPNVEVIGQGINATNLIISADVVGVVLQYYSKLQSVKITKSGTHTKDGVQVGSATLDGGRATIQQVWVDGVGRDGIQIRNGNLGTLRDVVCTSNGRDGINFTTETVDNNAWKLEGFIDVRGNTRDGLHIEQGASQSDVYASKCHSGDLIIAQQNGRYGVYSGTRSNMLKVYSEANTTYDLFLDTYAYGNQIELVECQTYADGGQHNVISHHNADADYFRAYKGKMQFQGGLNKGLRIDQSDGLAGRLDIEKDAVRHYVIKAGGSSADQNLVVTHEDYPTYKTNLTVGGNVIVGPSGGGLDLTVNGGSTTLKYYIEGTWTPALKFGLGSTGIAYGTQTGKYTRIGNLVTVTFEIALTNKGSSTGEASITGLPFAAAALHALNVYLYANFSSTYKDGIGYLNGSTINEIAANGTAAFTDAQFTNTSRFFGTCSYMV